MTLLGSTLWRAAQAVDDRRARSRQRALGVSSVGLCRRRAAYISHRVRPTDAPPRPEAILGTWIHAGALRAVRTQHGALTEVRVSGRGTLGRLDAYYPPADLQLPPRRVRDPLLSLLGIVEDVKTIGPFSALHLERTGPYRSHLWQVHMYAELLRTVGAPGHRVLGGLGPLPVDAVRIRYIRRDTGAEAVFPYRFDPRIAQAAFDWLEQARSYVDPQDAPRDHRGPTTSQICRSCPFVSRCWPRREDGRTPESSLVRDDAEIERQLMLYARYSRIEAAAKARKAEARSRLDAAPAGRYGRFSLSWRGGRPVRATDARALVVALAGAAIEPPMVLDVRAAEQLAIKAGLAVPSRMVPAKSGPSIWVTTGGDG